MNHQDRISIYQVYRIEEYSPPHLHQRSEDKGQGIGQRKSNKRQWGVKNVYILHHFATKKTPNCFSHAAGYLKNVYMAIFRKKNQVIFWSVVRFCTEFFSLRKKKLFSPMSDCLSNFDWSFVVLSNPLSSAAFLEDKGQKC